MSDHELLSIVDHIERLEEQQKGLLANKRAIYTKAKNASYNTRALRRLIAERRMPDREQVEAAMRDYRIRLGMAVNNVEHGASLRQAAQQHGVSKSAVHRAVPRTENSQEGQPAEALPEGEAAVPDPGSMHAAEVADVTGMPRPSSPRRAVADSVSHRR